MSIAFQLGFGGSAEPEAPSSGKGQVRYVRLASPSSTGCQRVDLATASSPATRSPKYPRAILRPSLLTHEFGIDLMSETTDCQTPTSSLQESLLLPISSLSRRRRATTRPWEAKKFQTASSCELRASTKRTPILKTYRSVPPRRFRHSRSSRRPASEIGIARGRTKVIHEAGNSRISSPDDCHRLVVRRQSIRANQGT
jgi:hypothetical protein